MAGVPKPTEFELEILQELWREDERTVRQVWETIAVRRPMVYTSVLKAMQVMHEKGLVRRDESQRSHLYSAAVREQDVKKNLVGNVVDQVFGGSAADLAMHALTNRPVSDDELRKISDLLDTMEKGRKRGSKRA